MRDASDIEGVMTRHADTVWRVCTLYFQDAADRQDAFQDAFIKYALSDEKEFQDDEHRKAWLITVTRNLCLDQLKRAGRKNTEINQDVIDVASSTDPAVQPGSALSDVADAFRRLDDPPRTPLYLSLYEGYPAPEIASMMDVPVNTVYSWISRGKTQLRRLLS